jgi:hypothetical protein
MTDMSGIEMGKPANDEMIQGYMDGYDLTAPEPSDNRSHSYRHSFYIGRAEKLGLPMISGRELERHADDAMAADEYGR